MEKVKRHSIINQVFDDLKLEITSGKYTEGDKLPSENVLCAELGVGRSTVREAYRMLQSIGYLDVKAGKGYFLKRIVPFEEESAKFWFTENKAKLSDLLEVRLAIEPLAVKLAIKKGKEEQIAEIARIHHRFLSAAQKSNAIELARLDKEFHSAIIKATNNELLVKIDSVIADALRNYRIKAFSVEKNVQHAVKPHGFILNSIIEKNIFDAVDAVTNHLQISWDDIEKEAEKEVDL